MGDWIIYLLACGFTAAILAGIGLFQLRSGEPVGFYTGQKPPKPQELTDVRAWNRGHGRLWLFYGAAVLLAGFLPLFVKNGLVLAAALAALVFGGLLALLWGHRRLMRRCFHPESEGGGPPNSN